MKLTAVSEKRARQAGFTLVETVAASGILAVCAAGIMSALAGGFQIAGMTQHNQRATQILMEATEIVRLYSWDQLNTPGFVPATFAEYYEAGTQSGIVYTGTVTISEPPEDMPASYRDRVRLFTVTLNWTSGDLPRSRSLTTLIARDGVQNYVY